MFSRLAAKEINVPKRVVIAAALAAITLGVTAILWVFRYQTDSKAAYEAALKLPPGTTINAVMETIQLKPVARCETATELAQVVSTRAARPSQVLRPVDGPVLVYRHWDIPWLTFFYFDRNGRLRESVRDSQAQ